MATFEVLDRRMSGVVLGVYLWANDEAIIEWHWQRISGSWK